jgi:hypothetical protein
MDDFIEDDMGDQGAIMRAAKAKRKRGEGEGVGVAGGNGRYGVSSDQVCTMPMCSYLLSLRVR